MQGKKEGDKRKETDKGRKKEGKRGKRKKTQGRGIERCEGGRDGVDKKETEWIPWNRFLGILQV
jgi:hypothetical protein